MKPHFFGVTLVLGIIVLGNPPNIRPQSAPSTPVKDQTVVLVGAGDIADCKDLSGAEATAKLVEQIPGTVMVPGDLAYPDGSKENFQCYDKTWGRVKSRTRPSPGNHEFHAAAATPYFDYFGSVAGNPENGYYSYELGTWHIIVLNSECRDVGGCDAGSRQEKWLRADLAAHPVACTLAYWHKPLFSSGGAHGNDPEIKPIWQALYEANADVVVNGHDHDYERFAPPNTGRHSRCSARRSRIRRWHGRQESSPVWPDQTQQRITRRDGVRRPKTYAQAQRLRLAIYSGSRKDLHRFRQRQLPLIWHRQHEVAALWRGASFILGKLRRPRPRLSSVQPFPPGKVEEACGRLPDSSPNRQDRRLRRDREALRAFDRHSVGDL